MSEDQEKVFLRIYSKIELQSVKKWFAVTQKHCESVGQSNSQLPQKWFAFGDANPPISSPGNIHYLYLVWFKW